MDNPILEENRKKRLTIRLPLLICFAMFVAWQMGVIYFSGTALSIGGRTPLPVSVQNLTLLIVAGYAASIAFLILLPRFVVIAERVTATAALLSALALYLPLPPEVLAGAFYFQYFCCVFMIGFEMAIIINLFSEETAIRHLSVAYGVSYIIVAVLQNDVIRVPFSGFRIFMIIALILMLIFFFRLPAKTWPRYVKKADGLVRPRGLCITMYALFVAVCFLTLFGTAVAETTVHGVMVMSLASGIFGGAVFLLWKRFGISPLRSVAVLVALGTLGFVFAILALYVPVFSLVSCALMGAGITACWLNPFFGIVLTKRYPSRFITPALLLVALGTVIIHSLLLEAFRGSPQILYIAYLAISVFTAILYLVMEPVLNYSFREQFLPGTAVTKPEEPKTSLGDESDRPVVPVPPKAAELAVYAVDHLSGQEIRLAELIMQGYGNAEMAKILHITGNTVKGYRKTLYSKLQIHSRRELFELAERTAPDRDEGVR